MRLPQPAPNSNHFTQVAPIPTIITQPHPPKDELPLKSNHTIEPNQPIAGNAPRQSTRAHDLFVEPLDWQQLCARMTLTNAPIELEIGSGKGLFLQQASASRPQHNFIGVELSGKFANRAAERLARHAANNVQMLRGDAEAFLLKVVPDSCVSAVHVYFPDPWWRRKHKKRRVLNDETLAAIERILVPGGKFHFWTDVLDYYELICRHVIEQMQLSGPHYVPKRAAQHDLDYTTHFERRARRNLQPIYRAVFAKKAA